MQTSCQNQPYTLREWAGACAKALGWYGLAVAGVLAATSAVSALIGAL